ncbi:MAG TPA: hypothetical protein VFO29_02730 [Candidatus Rubrimentiphilum sp.]|nr:hypothetical protein [Candidatus Rubrimentiphilum sp.]
MPNETLHVPGYWFASYNAGEFGGDLWVYNEDGSVGRRLLGQPSYGLLPYGDDVLAESGARSPFFSPPWRIHRFALRNGGWQEISHTDFPLNVVGLVNLRGKFYGIGAVSYKTISLVTLSLAGEIQRLWTLNGDLSLRSIAMSAEGDLAIGARGYVIRLHPTSNGFAATWYAPSDCVRYSADENEGFDARCIGMLGTRSYEHHYQAPPLRYVISRDGNWILPCCNKEALHFVGGRWTTTTDVPPVSKPYFESIEAAGDDLFVYDARGAWVRHLGVWSKVGSELDCGPVPTVAQTVAWCFLSSPTNATVTGFRADGSSLKVDAGPSDLLAAGLEDDAWFSEPGKPVLGHISSAGVVQGLTVQSPIASLSRGSSAMWFTERDRLHYGYVDAKGAVHEFDLFADSPVIAIQGARRGAWIEYSFLNRRLFVRHVAETQNGVDNQYIGDIRSFIVAPDGAAWAQSNNAQTIERLSEEGDATLYRVPCFDPNLRLFHAPESGVWFISNLSHCSGLIDRSGIHVRSLPLVDYVEYK